MELLNALSTSRAKALFPEKAAHRTGVVLIPTGDPRVFTTPEVFLHTPGVVTIDVFHNGRRLLYTYSQTPEEGEFYVAESVPGGGFNEIHFVAFTPNSRSTLIGNYYAA